MLKDILLVFASMTIFGDPVAPLQYFGYSIALGGLVYYKLGGEKMQQLGTQTKLTVGNFRQENPGAAKAIMICAGLAFVGLLFFGWSSESSPLAA